MFYFINEKHLNSLDSPLYIYIEGGRERERERERDRHRESTGAPFAGALATSVARRAPALPLAATPFAATPLAAPPLAGAGAGFGGMLTERCRVEPH